MARAWMDARRYRQYDMKKSGLKKVNGRRIGWRQPALAAVSLLFILITARVVIGVWAGITIAAIALAAALVLILIPIRK